MEERLGAFSLDAEAAPCPKSGTWQHGQSGVAWLRYRRRGWRQERPTMLRSPLRLSLAAVTVLAAAAVFAPTAAGVPLTASAPVEASTTNPLAACPPDGSGVNFPGSEVEPWLEVNPVDPDNVVTFYQQDRYSDGGAKGNVAAVSFDGGLSFPTRTVPP